MADKVIWNTGDTITADKLNGSGVFIVPLTMGNTGYYTSETTAKEVADAVAAGCLIVAVESDTGEWGADVTQNICNTVTVELPETVSMTWWNPLVANSTTLTAEYPDGTFSDDGGK